MWADCCTYVGAGVLEMLAKSTKLKIGTGFEKMKRPRPAIQTFGETYTPAKRLKVMCYGTIINTHIHETVKLAPGKITEEHN